MAVLRGNIDVIGPDDEQGAESDAALPPIEANGDAHAQAPAVAPEVLAPKAAPTNGHTPIATTSRFSIAGVIGKWLSGGTSVARTRQT